MAGTTVEGRLLAKSGAVTLDTNTVSATTCLTAGPLSISPAPAGNFASLTVSGVAQTTTAVLDAFSVADPRGTGAGWYVTADATRFTGPLRQLAGGSLSISQPVVTAGGGAVSLPPTVAPGPYTVDGPAAVSIAIAGTNAGMGTCLFAATTLTLALPADVYAGTYASTITISAVSAP